MLTTPANCIFDACGDRVPVFWVALTVNRHKPKLDLKNSNVFRHILYCQVTLFIQAGAILNYLEDEHEDIWKLSLAIYDLTCGRSVVMVLPSQLHENHDNDAANVD